MPVQPPAVDIVPMTGGVFRFVLKSKPVGVPFDASPQFGALIVTVGFGLAGTYTALGRKPAQVLRNL